MQQKSIDMKRDCAAIVLRSMLLAVMLLAAGCQFIPSQDNTAASGDSEVSADGSGESPAEPAVIRTANPYLIDPPAVPGQAQRRFASAQQAFSQQQWAAAETDLLWITSNYPQFSGPFLSLAEIYQQTGEEEKVEPALRQAIATNPNNIDAYNALGIYLRGKGRFQEAESSYQQALERWPDSPATHLNLGILYDLYMGRLAQALEHYRYFQALQEQPDRRVEGWIVDTERRIQQQQSPGGES